MGRPNSANMLLTALEYYRLWNQGRSSVNEDCSLTGIVAMARFQLLWSEEAATTLQGNSQDWQPDTGSDLEFHESNRDENGVAHFFFQSRSKPQYLAVQSKRLIHAELARGSSASLGRASRRLCLTARPVRWRAEPRLPCGAPRLVLRPVAPQLLGLAAQAADS